MGELIPKHGTKCNVRTRLGYTQLSRLLGGLLYKGERQKCMYRVHASVARQVKPLGPDAGIFCPSELRRRV